MMSARSFEYIELYYVMQKTGLADVIVLKISLSSSTSSQQCHFAVLYLCVCIS